MMAVMGTKGISRHGFDPCITQVFGFDPAKPNPISIFYRSVILPQTAAPNTQINIQNATSVVWRTDGRTVRDMVVSHRIGCVVFVCWQNGKRQSSRRQCTHAPTQREEQPTAKSIVECKKKTAPDHKAFNSCFGFSGRKLHKLSWLLPAPGRVETPVLVMSPVVAVPK